MGTSARQSWLRAAVLVGIIYALTGILFAMPATHARARRLAAWAVSAVGFGAHIAYERFRLRQLPISSALHVAAGAAMGAFGLAVGAVIHSLSSGSGPAHRQLLLFALGIWPVITAVPAFVVALVANAVLVRAVRRPDE